MPSRESRPVPSHVCGSTTYYYDLGCREPACIEAASAAKAANRARHAAERVWVVDHWEHPDLKPFDSDSPRRHGTKYARTTFKCECSHCKPRPGAVTFPGTSLLWAGNVDERVAGSVLAVAVAVAIYRLLPAIVVQIAPLVRAILVDPQRRGRVDRLHRLTSRALRRVGPDSGWRTIVPPPRKELRVKFTGLPDSASYAAEVLTEVLDELDQEYEASRTHCPEDLPGLSFARSIVRCKLDRLIATTWKP